MPGIFLNEALTTAANIYTKTRPVANAVVKGAKASAPYISKAGDFVWNNRDNIEHGYHIAHKFKQGGYDSDINTIKHDIMNAPKNIASGVSNASKSAVNGIANAPKNIVNGVNNTISNVPFVKEDKYITGKCINDFSIGKLFYKE